MRPCRLDGVDAAVRESARRARGPRRFRDGVHSTQEDDVGDVAAELPRPPPDSDDEDEGVELVDLNRAPAPAVAQSG